jgi:hypothetical protein
MPGEDFASIDFPFRFKVVNVVPVAAVLLTVGTVVLSGAPGHAPQRQALFDNAREFGWTGAVAVLAATVVIALLAEPLELASIRFLEGYWPMAGPLGRVRAAGLRAQRRRHSRLTFLAKKVVADPAVSGHAARRPCPISSRRPRPSPVATSHGRHRPDRTPARGGSAARSAQSPTAASPAIPSRTASP